MRRVLFALVMAASGAHADELASRMLDDDPSERIAAIAAYRSRDARSVRGVPLLVEAIADNDRTVRREARITLATLGRRALAKYLSERESSVRFLSWHAATDKAVRSELKSLCQHKDARLRYRAANALR